MSPITPRESEILPAGTAGGVERDADAKAVEDLAHDRTGSSVSRGMVLSLESLVGSIAGG
jgi:hypothetical protein